MLNRIKKELARHWQLYLFALIPIVNVLFHQYGPMYGIQIAFRNYNPRDGIWNSEWVGLKWFKQFLSDPKFSAIFWNTVKLSLYNIVVTFPFPIIFAVFLNCVNNKRFKGFVQNITYMPHFISVTVLVGILTMVLSPVSGIYGSIFRLMGGNGYPADFRYSAAAFRHLYVWSGVWQNLGWDSILYTSALAGVSLELHEAAKIDGASRFKRVLYVDLPAIKPTIAIMLIMKMGGVVGADFEKTYLLQSNLNLTKSEVLATYVYKKGFSGLGQFSYSASISMFNTIINLVLLWTANYICKKVTENEVSYF